MKTLLLSLFMAFIAMCASAQTASDFTCNDCLGHPHHLFAELDSGYVVVLVWVMPCGTCVPGTLTAQSVVNSFAASNPGRVRLYIADDYANTSCTSLNSWCTGNGITTGTKFSNAAVSMTSYGVAGMPKVIVVANTTHKVYFNANGTISGTGLQAAINTAISEWAVGVEETPQGGGLLMQVSPNPADAQAWVQIETDHPEMLTISLLNSASGKIVYQKTQEAVIGRQQIRFDTQHYASGTYELIVHGSRSSAHARLAITHP